MSTWSSTITSWPGKFIDGDDGTNGRPAKKRFDFPGMETNIIVEPGFSSTARLVNIVIVDDATDPNYFDVQFEFEFESNVGELGPDGCTVHGHLWEGNPAENPNQKVVSEFSINWPRQCGILLCRPIIKHAPANRYGAAKRSNYAWFYFVAHNRSVKYCR